MKAKHCADAKEGVVHSPHVWASEFGPRKCGGHRPQLRVSTFRPVPEEK